MEANNAKIAARPSANVGNGPASSKPENHSPTDMATNHPTDSTATQAVHDRP